MCGIAGGIWWDVRANPRLQLEAALDLLQHRGPDDRGVDVENSSQVIVALGHTRLSIIDLSQAGHQPMVSRDGRYRIVFNGEIFNYRELREVLFAIGCHFHSDSDTEVLLQAWQTWGVECLPRLQGMFAFVVHDRQKQSLTCVRDGFGIKPFFYAWRPEWFGFASELQPLLTLRGEKSEVNWQRAYDYLVHGDYDSNEQTFIAGIKHLSPAHWVTLDLKSGQLGTPVRWWQPSIRENDTLSFDQAAEAVRAQFLENIRLHLRSDVPLGAALSGGIDSSSVVCAMRYLQPDAPIHTFSFNAKGTAFSEERWVDRVNAEIGAIPHKFVATGQELASDLDDMIQAQGEPVGSTSIYAQYRVFKLARETGITVTLDGQGADELLAGYAGYPGQRLLSLLERGSLTEALSFAAKWSRWPGRSYKEACMSLGRQLLPDGPYKKARKLLGRDFSPIWLDVSAMRDAGVKMNEIRPLRASEHKGRRVVEHLAYSLQYHGLPKLLRHADRNAMRFSIESRVPFLTLPMANLLLNLPEDYLISSNGETKAVFRAAMRGIVPGDVLDRTDKIGFATPEQDWLTGMAPVLREWLKDSEVVPFINSYELIKRFDAIVVGRQSFSWQVWRWVNFVRWYAQQDLLCL